jgi:site-specific DNA-cytosine methylase
MNKKYLSFFSGALGLDLGLEKKGWECLAVNEFDKKICETINALCETTGSLSGGALMPIIEIPVAHEERFITIMNEINQTKK